MYRDPIFNGSQVPRVQPEWEALGFKFGDKGAHTSRTMMLDELTALLAVSPAKATREDYTRALVEENCLGKQTLSTRKLSLQRLTELYALEPAVALFRLLR